LGYKIEMCSVRYPRVSTLVPAVLNAIILAEDRTHAERAIKPLVSDYGAKWPQGRRQGNRRGRDAAHLLQLLAEHWLH